MNRRFWKTAAPLATSAVAAEKIEIGVAAYLGLEAAEVAP